MNNVVGSGYAKEEDDSRFVAQSGSGESIATSYGEYDNGLFELKFDDDRFLPFEGAGAISSWDIEMPRTNNQFDFSTMTDFVLHIHYTAQEGGEALGTAATTQLEAILPEKGMLLVGLKQCFPAAWEDFYHPEAGAVQKFSFTLLKEHYPFLARSRNMKLTHVGLVVSGVHSGAYIARLNLPGQADIECTLTKDASLNNVHHKPDVFSGTAAATGDFTLMIRRDTAGASDFSSLPENDLDDVIFVLNYSK